MNESVINSEKKSIFQKVDLKNPNIILLFAGIILVVVLALIVPKFLTPRNISNIFVTASSTGLMAIGLTFVMITSGIDLSCPTVMALSAILGAQTMVTTGNVFIGIVVIISIGVLFGVINGISVAKIKMVPMIVTLAVSTIASGIANWYTGARSITGMPDTYPTIFTFKIAGVVPVQAVIFIGVTFIMHIILKRTKFGRSVYMVGVNEKAAKVNGIKTEKVIFGVYVIAGLMYALSGVLSGARSNAAGPSLGTQDNFMDIVCAVVLGGTSVSGGKGSVIGTFIGCIFMTVITNVMNLMNIEYFITYVIKGIIIVLITYFDVIRNKNIGKR